MVAALIVGVYCQYQGHRGQRINGFVKYPTDYVSFLFLKLNWDVKYHITTRKKPDDLTMTSLFSSDFVKNYSYDVSLLFSHIYVLI